MIISSRLHIKIVNLKSSSLNDLFMEKCPLENLETIGFPGDSVTLTWIGPKSKSVRGRGIRPKRQQRNFVLKESIQLFSPIKKERVETNPKRSLAPYDKMSSSISRIMRVPNSDTFIISSQKSNYELVIKKGG